MATVQMELPPPMEAPNQYGLLDPKIPYLYLNKGRLRALKGPLRSNSISWKRSSERSSGFSTWDVVRVFGLALGLGFPGFRVSFFAGWGSGC